MRPLLRFVLLMCILSVSTLIPSAVPRTSAATSTSPRLGNYDIRVFGGDEATALLSVYAPAGKQNTAHLAATQAAMLQGVARLKGAVPGADVRFSQLFGAAEVVRSEKGSLTPPTPGRDASLIVKDFLRSNQALYGLSSAEVGALHFLGESRSPANGLRMVRFEQQVNGISVFQSDTRFIVTADGRLVRSVGLLVPSLTAAAAPLGKLISAAEALAAAMASVGITFNADAAQLTNASEDGATTEVVIGHPAIADAVYSQLVYFPLAPGLVVPAWSQVTYTSGEGDWYTLVDATTGTLLWRKNIRSAPLIAPDEAPSRTTPSATVVAAPTIQRQPSLVESPPQSNATTQDARFSVYVQSDGVTPTSPAPHNPTTVTPGSGTQFPAINRTTVSMLAVQDTTASPNGWIPDGGTTTTGNNVDAYLDIDVTGAANNVPDNRLDATGRPTGNPDSNARNRDFLGTTPRNYGYTPAPLVNNPDAGDAPASDNFRRGVVTQLFYVTNWFHDKLYQLGFDEAAGNFQNDNFGRGGVGNDHVLAEAQDGSGTNNANFSTPPDGQPGRMQMFVFNGSNPDRDASLDADIVIHELAHGLSNRLIGNGNGLWWDVGASMGEGWSDFYALSLLYGNHGDDPDARYTVGAYATYKLTSTFNDNYLYAIRRFPYSTDNSVNPLTWADVDDTTFGISSGIPNSPATSTNNGALQVHSAGELWALSLWEVRSRIIADPAGANGNVPLGNQTMLQLTTDAMKLTPINPSFIDARDALLDADCATNACANERSIWEGFADRGLGYEAVVSTSYGGLARFGGQLGMVESVAIPNIDVANVVINDSSSNANNAIDPGELISLTVNLKNPWQNQATAASNVQATLSSATPGVTIQGSTANYGTLAGQGTASGTFAFNLASGAACGQSLKFTLQISSSLGTVSREISLRVGQASGTGTPIEYTRTIPGGLAIPDGDGRGITDSFTISDDVVIADLDFRVDSLTHTYTGDIGLMLKAPNGYGTSMIYYRGMFYNDSARANGDNFINTVIDDEASADLNQSLANQAPFTGSWKTPFNAAFWTLFGETNLGPDPVGQLSRLDGTSTQGVWQVNVKDVYEMDAGSLNAWSLIVTPTTFSCATFTPSANVAGTKSVAGSTTPGSTITYTVLLTNTGTAAQGDNAGAEFTDVLPAQLTLLSASASAGTASANVGTRTVTWNGSIPINGSVKLTINAKINDSATGTVNNQGTIAYDSDNDGNNDATALTDDPSTVAANDPTSFVISTSGAPNITATQVAALTTDLNGDGKVNPGDTLTYTVVVNNIGTSNGLGVVFTSGLDANTRLVIGSVTTSRGSVTSGNSAGNTTATVGLGTLAPGSSATITFRATVQQPLSPSVTQIASQGTVTGSNVAQVLTDNPATAAPNDATVTLVQYLASLYLSFIGK